MMFRENNIQLLIPDRRFSFTEKKHGAWFHTSWFTYGLNLPNDLNFIKLGDSVYRIMNDELSNAA
jgi:hypothetical protein